MESEVAILFLPNPLHQNTKLRSMSYNNSTNMIAALIKKWLNKIELQLHKVSKLLELFDDRSFVTRANLGEFSLEVSHLSFPRLELGLQ